MSDYRFKEFFRPGEYIVWQCWPDPKLHFNALDRYLLPLSLVLLALTISWGWDKGFLGWLGIFAVLYVALGRFLFKAWRKRSTKYVVTNQRLFVVSDLFKFRVRMVELKSVAHLQRQGRSDSYHGTLAIGQVSPVGAALANSGLEIFTGAFWLPEDAVLLHDLSEPEKTQQIIGELKSKAA